MKEKKLEEPMIAGGFKTYQIQNEVMKSRERVAWLESDIELGGETVLEPRSTRDYRTVNMIETAWARRLWYI